jgi:drug/metabolite transporter (DMT)-like permease
LTAAAIDVPPTTRSPERVERNRRLAGIGFMCLALACFSGLDSTDKWLSRDLPILDVVFVRYCGALLLMSAVLNPMRVVRPWATPRLWLQILRGLALFGSTLSNFVALRTMPLADVMAINFSVPFLIALLAGPILGERISAKQWAAIVVGFGGVLIITHPGAGAFDPAVLWVFGSVVSNSLYAITTRQLSSSASTSSMLLISAAIPTLLMLPSLPFIWVWPQHLSQWIEMATMGCWAYVGHYFMIRAYTLAPAPIVAPFTYSQIIWATLSGFLLFGDIPGVMTVVGALIVVASGLYLLYLETWSKTRTA